MPLSTHSDSEDDFDYVPPADDGSSNSSGEQDGVEDTTETAPPEKDPAEQKKQRDALWASFQASVSTPPSEPRPSTAVTRVKIEKTHLFAGKHVMEVVEVPEDSEEAKKWPRWSPRPTPPESARISTPCSEQGGDEGDSHASPSSSLAVDPVPVSAGAAALAAGSKRPGPRKSRTTLPSIPKVSHAKKITTLDKSAMDWRAHVASQSGDVKDGLDANRRGGGYLEKVDFLKRVQDRREEAFEASKSSKRRKA